MSFGQRESSKNARLARRRRSKQFAGLAELLRHCADRSTGCAGYSEVSRPIAFPAPYRQCSPGIAAEALET